MKEAGELNPTPKTHIGFQGRLVHQDLQLPKRRGRRRTRPGLLRTATRFPNEAPLLVGSPSKRQEEGGGPDPQRQASFRFRDGDPSNGASPSKWHAVGSRTHVGRIWNPAR